MLPFDLDINAVPSILGALAVAGPILRFGLRLILR